MKSKVYNHITQEYHVLNELFRFYRGEVSTSWLNRYTILQTFFDPIIKTEFELFPGYEGDEWIEVCYEDICIPSVEPSFRELCFSDWPLINSYEEIVVEEAQLGKKSGYQEIVLDFFSEDFLWESRICLKELKYIVNDARKRYYRCLETECQHVKN